MIAIDISKQQALDTNPKSIQQIKYTVNLNRGWNVNAIFFRFFIRNCESIVILFCFDIISIYMTQDKIF